MSSTQYLEFDSSYRDRNAYPFASEFVAEISQSGNKEKSYAKDPVSDASPILFWNSSFDDSTASLSVTITGIVLTNTVSDNTTFLITASSGDLRAETNYYKKAILTLTNSTPTTVRTRILSYELINATTAQVTVETSIPNDFMTGAVSGNIQNPTGATNTDLIPKVFIPMGINGDNYFVNYLIHNISTNEFFTITHYDAETSMATLSGNTSATWASTNANFAIRKARPIRGTIVSVYTNPLALQLATTTSNVSGSLNSSFIRMIQPVPTAPFSTLVSPYSEEVKIGRYVAGTGLITSVAGTSFSLDPSTSSSENNFYVGALITDTTTNNTAQITSWNGTTRTGTTSGAWTANAGNTWVMNTAIMAGTFGTNPTAGQLYELEMYTRDNWVPFSFVGSLVSTQQPVCYEVELINLILPNTLLKSGRGGREIFYPYMYVQLQQVSAPDNKYLINSNNPNAVNMMFRAVIDDTTQPENSPFIKVDSDSMTHTCKFKPSDSFIFSVRHSNGELLKTVLDDFYSPTEPNPLCQISACFSFKRKDKE
jgi:hypothetical protein